MVGFFQPLLRVPTRVSWLRGILARILPERMKTPTAGPGVCTFGSPTTVSAQSSLEEGLFAVTDISCLTKTQAEHLLDWLEANGKDGWELEPVGDKGFTLRRS